MTQICDNDMKLSLKAERLFRFYFYEIYDKFEENNKNNITKQYQRPHNKEN